MDFLMGFAYFAFDALAILLLVAIWQRSHVTGFLVLAGSYGLGIVARWGVSLSYRFIDSETSMALSWLYQSLWLVVSAVAIYGLWDIYLHFKRAATVVPPTA